MARTVKATAVKCTTSSCPVLWALSSPPRRKPLLLALKRDFWSLLFDYISSPSL